MKIPKPKFKVGERVSVDKDFFFATIAQVGVFKKNGKTFVAYQLKDCFLPGFWANENRIKIIKRSAQTKK